MIFISTMEKLPEMCYECPCHNEEHGNCQADKERRYNLEYRPFWCPLKETEVKIEEKQNEWRKMDFHVGDVIQTKGGLDRGLVTKVDVHNMPSEVMSSPGLNIETGDYTEIIYYGGSNYVNWYKTGEHMTPQEWNKLYSGKEGWQRYCEDRQNQIKIDD